MSFKINNNYSKFTVALDHFTFHNIAAARAGIDSSIQQSDLSEIARNTIHALLDQIPQADLVAKRSLKSKIIALAEPSYKTRKTHESPRAPSSSLFETSWVSPLVFSFFSIRERALFERVNTAWQAKMPAALHQELTRSPRIDFSKLEDAQHLLGYSLPELFSLTHSLEQFDLSKNYLSKQLLTSHSLHTMLTSISSPLNTLIVANCPVLEDETLAQVVNTHYKTLSHLDLSGWTRISDASWQILSRTTLRIFSINGVNVFNHEKLMSILPALSKLSTLRLNSCRIEDPHLSSIVTHCPDLTSLSLDENLDLTSEGVKELTRLTALEHLSLRMCFNAATDEIVIAMSEKLINLKKLNLAFCVRLSDQAVLALAIRLQDLSDLDLSHCTALTNQSFNALKQRPHLLPRLKLDGCWKISPEKPPKKPRQGRKLDFLSN